MSGSTKAPSKSANGTRQRRWRIPQPLLRDGSSPGPEGLAILDEIESEMGWVMVKTLRSVILWSQVEPRARKGLFEAEAADRRQVEILSTVPGEEEELRKALEALLAILSKPERADPEEVGIACTRISAWAERHGAPQTALEFTQAAALACPANPRLALQVGRTARDLARYGQAEAWLQRAVGLARQVSDWEIYVRSYLAHGTMLMRRGALPAARRSFLKAQRRASRQGVRAWEAMAFHDLFALAVQMGDLDEALVSAENAARAYRQDHEGFANFAHDVGYLWMQHGQYSHAYPIFSAALNRVEESCRPFVLGSLARAAAGLGDREAFESAAKTLEDYGALPGVAEAWVEIARGAMILGDHADAKQAAEIAERVAKDRGEGQVRFMAESVIEAAEAEARAVEVRKAEAEHAPNHVARRERLARELLQTLTTAGEVV